MRSAVRDQNRVPIQAPPQEPKELGGVTPADEAGIAKALVSQRARAWLMNSCRAALAGRRSPARRANKPSERDLCVRGNCQRGRIICSQRRRANIDMDMPEAVALRRAPWPLAIFATHGQQSMDFPENPPGCCRSAAPKAIADAKGLILGNDAATGDRRRHRGLRSNSANSLNSSVAVTAPAPA